MNANQVKEYQAAQQAARLKLLNVIAETARADQSVQHIQLLADAYHKVVYPGS